MTTPLTGDLIGSAEAQNILGVSRSVVVRMVQTGKLACARKMFGATGAYLFERADVEAIATERRAELQAALDRIGAA